MKPVKFAIPILLLTVTGLLLSSCGQEEVVPTGQRAVPVEGMVVGTSDARLARTFTGSVEGERQANIYAKIAEAVERVQVEEGDRVSAGQVLISLDKTGPTSNYRSAESVYKNSRKQYEKMKYLYEEGAVSESQFDAARTDYEVAKANFEAAARLVEVTSPIDGVVTRLEVSPGDYLNQGQKLATVASIEKLRVKFSVNSRDIQYIDVGDTVMVEADELGQSVSGRVVRVSRSADPVTRAFQVEVLFDNENGRFRPGMFVRVSIILEQLENVIIIPRKSVVTLDNEEVVFTVSDTLAHRQVVSLGPGLDGRVVIESGLSPGDTVVTIGQTYLDDGYQVRITDVEKAPR